MVLGKKSFLSCWWHTVYSRYLTDDSRLVRDVLDNDERLILFHISQQKLFCDRQEKVMPAGVEMRCVVGFLEVELAEGWVAHVYAAHAAVKDWNGTAAGDVLDDVDDALHIGFGGVGPWGEEEDPGLGILADECVADISQTVAQQLLTDGVGLGDVGRYAVGVVVSGNDDDIVERIAHPRHTLINGFTVFAFAVDGDTRAVASIIEVNHTVFLGKLVVPGIGLWLMVVVDIAVTDKGDALACQWIFLCLRGQEGRQQ